MQVTDENSLKDFECPVCYHYLSQPIYQCPTGHSVCGTCKGKLTKCYCQKEYGNIRNYTLEKIVDKITIECKYKECKKIVKLSEFVQHTATCSNADVTCKGCIGTGAAPCEWKGLSTDLRDHIKTDHKAYNVRNCSDLKTHQLTWCVIEVGTQMFWVKRYFGDADPVMLWTVQSALPLPAEEEYTLMVKVSAPNGSIHMLKQPCCNNHQESEEKLKSHSFMALRKRKARSCIFHVSIHKVQKPVTEQERAVETVIKVSSSS